MYREFDLFHRPVRLNYQGSDRFTTHAGFFFTVCVVAITVIQAALTFYSIFTYESPQVTVDRTILSVPNPINLTEAGFKFAIKMPDLHMNSPLLTLKVEHYTAVQHSNGTIEELFWTIPFGPCTAEYFKGYEEEFHNWGLDEAICPYGDVDLRISGYYRNPIAEQILISIHSCKNDSVNRPDVVCASTEEITKYFEENAVYGASVEVFYTNTIITPTSHSEPVKYNLDSFYWYLLPGKMVVDAELPLNQQDIITDDNLLFENWNPKNLTTFTVDPAEIRTYARSLISFDDWETYTIAAIWIMKSRTMYTTRRLYPKLQQGLANIGSVFSLAVIVFGIFVKLYAQRAYPLHFANQFYDFDFQHHEKAPTKRKGSSKAADKSQRPSNTKKGSQNDKKIERKSSIPRGERKLDAEEDPRPSQQKITYGLGAFLISFIPCVQRKKKQIINKIIETAQKDFDLIEIAKKLYEFDRFKKLFLEDDEIMMLSYLKRPVISLDDLSLEKKVAHESRSKTSRIQETQVIEEKGLESVENLNQASPKSRESLDSPTRSPKKPSKNSYQKEHLDRFAKSLTAYNQLLKKMKHSPTSRKILKLMDPQISDTLFDFVIEPKYMDRLRMANVGTRDNNSASKKKQQAKRLSKLEAGIIIATKLKTLYLRRKRQKLKRLAKLASQSDETNTNEGNEDHSIIFEKPRIKHTRANQLKDLYRFENQSDVASITIELKESGPLSPLSPLDNKQTEARNDPPQTHIVENETPKILISTRELLQRQIASEYGTSKDLRKRFIF